MDKLVVFQDKKIRRTWQDEQWWFSIEDVISALTDSKNPKGYVRDMRRRDQSLSEGWGQIARTLSVPTTGGPQQMNCSNTRGLFRIIQSIPSSKAEPFKLWLSQVGYERIEEIENPERGQERIKEYYELKGYPKEWIDKRLRGIAVRQELTDEWKQRQIETEQEFAILTNEISKATFGKTVGEYREFKALKQKNHNLRDHMTDWELILTMIGEKATTDITKETDSQGLVECKDSAVKGGTIAKRTRNDLESTLGRTVLSQENFLPKTRKFKKQ